MHLCRGFAIEITKVLITSLVSSGDSPPKLPFQLHLKGTPQMLDAPTTTQSTMTLADILNGMKLRMTEQMDAAAEMKAKAYTDKERLHAAILDAAEKHLDVTPEYLEAMRNTFQRSLDKLRRS